MRAKHRLPKLALPEYALEGAVTRRGLWMGAMTEECEEELDKDIAEIEKRIKLVKWAEMRSERSAK